MESKKEEKQALKPLINKKLVSLKFVCFLFFAAMGCLFPFLPLHMTSVGMSYDDAKIITFVAPFVSILGPLLVGPLVDRIAAKKRTNAGRTLRIIIATCLIGAAIFYGLLLTVPKVQSSPEADESQVSFACDADGAVIFQKRCSEERTCYHWRNERMGSLVLTNCTYTCQDPSQFEDLYNKWQADPSTQLSTEETPAGNDPGTFATELDEVDDYTFDEPAKRERRAVAKVQVEPPHVCFHSTHGTTCHVYTVDFQSIQVEATLRSALNQENETHSASWCKYPLDGFTCNVPADQINYMHLAKNPTNCKAVIECKVSDPYKSRDSVLADSQCMIGDVTVTFWSYLTIRSIADIFAMATITLLDTAIIIATRETSMGRGDVGRQLAWGALGWAIFSTIMGAIEPADTDYLVPILMFVGLSIVTAITVLLSSEMPLTPSEWWWHTKIGMVAIPESTIRKYEPETGVLVFITCILGLFWSAIDSFQPWIIYEMLNVNAAVLENGTELTSELINDTSNEINLLIGLTWTVSAIISIPILWRVERIVDYCGHTNILIASFSIYILRFTGLAIIDEAWYFMFVEAVEPITLALTWATIILYIRHLMPYRLTSTGQAIIVIAHFCLGRGLGALVGLVESGDLVNSLRYVYQILAIVASFVAIIYFTLYHCYFAPYCAAKLQPPPSPLIHRDQQNGNGGNNTNGNYTPLRVYHNGRARKGHFKY